MQTYDCEPTLTDAQVLEFCKRGYLMLEGVVPDTINRRMCEYIDVNKFRTFQATINNPLGQEDWFVENVLLNSPSGGCRAVIAGQKFRPAHQAKQPLGSVSRSRATVAPGRRLPLRFRIEPPAGVLLSPRHAGGTRSNRGVTRVAFPFCLAKLDVTLQWHPWRSQNGGPGGHYFHNRLFDMAPGVPRLLSLASEAC